MQRCSPLSACSLQLVGCSLAGAASFRRIVVFFTNTDLLLDIPHTLIRIFVKTLAMLALVSVVPTLSVARVFFLMLRSPCRLDRIVV